MAAIGAQSFDLADIDRAPPQQQVEVLTRPNVDNFALRAGAIRGGNVLVRGTIYVADEDAYDTKRDACVALVKTTVTVVDSMGFTTSNVRLIRLESLTVGEIGTVVGIVADPDAAYELNVVFRARDGNLS